MHKYNEMCQKHTIFRHVLVTFDKKYQTFFPDFDQIWTIRDYLNIGYFCAKKYMFIIGNIRFWHFWVNYSKI